MDPLSPEAIEHDARMLFDAMMRDLMARDVEAADALALIRRVARDGNGWS